MKKILSIDGGGIKGVYAASFLAEMEEKCNVKIGDYFDLIAGTSTGAIIAAAIALGISAKKILELYLENGSVIFPQHKFISVFKGKYSTEPLKRILEDVFSSLCIQDCTTRLLIPSYNLENNKVRVFKTPHSEDLRFDQYFKITECLLAATAAPTYFNPYKMRGGTYMDGGIGANNPSFIALVEGLTRCGWPISDISLMSIGCVKEIMRTTGREKMGIINAQKILKCFMEAESQYPDNICNLMIPKGHYIRVNQSTLPNQVSLDKVSEQSIAKLKNWGIDSAMQYTDRVKKLFFDKKTEKMQFCNSES